jgi:hypothetical protein
MYTISSTSGTSEATTPSKTLPLPPSSSSPATPGQTPVSLWSIQIQTIHFMKI